MDDDMDRFLVHEPIRLSGDAPVCDVCRELIEPGDSDDGRAHRWHDEEDEG